jgi:carboxymethylenebutenolidase
MRILIALVTLACASKTNGEAAAPPPAAAPPSSPSQTYISEEAFIALHQHTDQPAPAAKGELIQIGQDRAYLSLPKDRPAPMPAVIVIHEWWGLNENVMHWADRIAAEGYAAIAVDLYQREVTDDPKKAMEIMKSVDNGRALQTLTAAHAFAKQDPRVQATKLGSIGWCFGGGWSLHASLALPMDATVIYYGHLTDNAEELKSLKGPVLGIFGDKDQGIPPQAVDAFERALGTAQIRHQILRFPADHAFANPSSARYDKVSATAAWEAARKFLAENLKN